MAPKIIKPLSDKARYIVNRAMADLGKEGYAIWGFVFASQPGSERLLDDGRDFVILEVFNNAGEDSIPLVIAKTEAALEVLRREKPLGVEIGDEFKRVIDEVNQSRPQGQKLTFDPHDQKPN